MKNNKPLLFPLGIIVRLLKIIGFVAGGFLLYRNRKKLNSLITRQGFIISAVYAVILAFIALFYRLIILLNWILQQAR